MPIKADEQKIYAEAMETLIYGRNEEKSEDALNTLLDLFFSRLLASNQQYRKKRNSDITRQSFVYGFERGFSIGSEMGKAMLTDVANHAHGADQEPASVQ